MGSEGLLEKSINIGCNMSVRRDYLRTNHGDTCEAEDLSMPVRKKLKGRTHPIQGPNSDVLNRDRDHVRRDYLKHAQQSNGVIHSFAVEMDIKEPLTKLRSLVEKRLGQDLSSSVVSLQDKGEMDLSSSLGDQCIQSDGRAEIRIEVKVVHESIRINIVDVLKLSGDDEDDELDEDYEEDSSVEDLSVKHKDSNTNYGQLDDRSDSSSVSDSGINSQISPNWSVVQNVTLEFPVPIPHDPALWAEEHTQHWLKWAIKEFNIKFVDDSMWTLNGEQFTQMTEDEFHQKVPLDPKNMFWTHIDLLRRYQVYAVPDRTGQRTQAVTTNGGNKQTRKGTPRKVRSPTTATLGTTSLKKVAMTGHNGQIQLWQFLLELLGDRNSKNVIQWVGRDGEFKLNDPELVAQMWGQRKNKPKMNYEKLSRALRYYYSEAMIAKVHGRRFVYKFVCNLKELIGYSTEELINLVEDEPAIFESVD